MKADKRIIISLAVIGVLLLYLVFSGGKNSDIPRIKKWDNTAEILVKDADRDIKIFKKDNKWVITESAFPADVIKIEKLEKAVKELEITDLISRNPYLEKYDLTPEKAIHVTVKSGSSIVFEFFIGKKSTTNRTTYIKLAAGDEIYLARGNLRDDFEQKIEDLRDKEICTFDKDSVTSIELNYKGSKLVFAKEEFEVIPEKTENENADDAGKGKQPVKEKKWICKEYKNLAINQSAVETLVGDFCNIKADSFPELVKEKVSGRLCTVRSNLQGKDVEFIINSEGKESAYICSSSESPYIFTIKDWKAKKFFKTINDFKEKEKK